MILYASEIWYYNNFYNSISSIFLVVFFFNFIFCFQINMVWWLVQNLCKWYFFTQNVVIKWKIKETDFSLCNLTWGSTLLTGEVQILILISPKLIMDSRKNLRWTSQFRKFSRVRSKLKNCSFINSLFLCLILVDASWTNVLKAIISFAVFIAGKFWKIYIWKRI